MVDLADFEEAQDQTAQQHAQALKKIADEAKVACEAIATRGVHPFEEILSTAQNQHCDVIWIASHGRRGLDRLLLGSETQRVLAHANLPVLVYR